MPARAARGTILWVAVLLALATVAVYLNGLPAPFVFDDIPSIPGNPTLEKLWPLSGPLSPPGEGLTVSGRPVLNLSFALNRAAGAGPAGFRMTNVAIHLGAGLLLFGLLRRTLLLPRLRGAFGAAALPLAAAIAALWLLHPLQTSAVSYIVQRAESLMGFFYLLTLYAFVRGVESNRPTRWFALAWAACLLGMGTKEVMFSAPLLVAAYDRCFVGGTWRAVWQGRKSLLLALAATWLVLVWLVWATGARGGMEIGAPADALTHWAGQFRVISAYLGLSVWPFPLVLDRGVERVSGANDVIPYAAGVIALAACTVLAWARRLPVGWLGVFFFAILAPTSLVPGGRQTMADHRMYLPLAAVLTLLVLGIYLKIGWRALAASAVAAALLGLATVQRNSDYRSVLSIWADTVAKRPDNRWARDNLGNALLESGRAAEALAQYEAALRLAPDDAVHHHNAGSALVQLGRLDAARARFVEAVRLAPDYVAARLAHGQLLYRLGRFADAAEEYRSAVRRAPGVPDHHYNLGLALLASGRRVEAVAELARTLQLAPDHAEAANNLGCILLEEGDLLSAVGRFEQALRAQPTHAEALANIGLTLARLGRIDEALSTLQRAVKSAPENADTHNSLGAVLLHLGRRDEAGAAWTEALRLNPDHPMARQNLGRLQRLPGGR
jgi:protein O-mannosyl-transferase